MARLWLAGAATIDGRVARFRSPRQAQASGEITLYAKGHFKGAQKVIGGPRQYIDPPFLVKSVTIPSGTQWELCSGSTYSGCRQFSQSVKAMVMPVRSVRPVAAILPVGRGNSGTSPRAAVAGQRPVPARPGKRVFCHPGSGRHPGRGASRARPKP